MIFDEWGRIFKNDWPKYSVYTCCLYIPLLTSQIAYSQVLQSVEQMKVTKNERNAHN